ncbi:MAG: class I SAM-dependent methyltransferase, partial [Verrucomicrobiota bacterium]
MTEEYHDAVARHYAAYRPPLHRLILQRQLEGRDRFRSGLDLGCGTGYSAVALTEFCDEVVGLDISRSMLDSASPHPQITYVEGRGDDLQRFPDGTFDIITFAGSLFYTRSEALR